MPSSRCLPKCGPARLTLIYLTCNLSSLFAWPQIQNGWLEESIVMYVFWVGSILAQDSVYAVIFVGADFDNEPAIFSPP